MAMLNNQRVDILVFHQEQVGIEPSQKWGFHQHTCQVKLVKPDWTCTKTSTASESRQQTMRIEAVYSIIRTSPTLGFNLNMVYLTEIWRTGGSIKPG